MQKGPEDDLYPTFPVTYLKIDRVPFPMRIGVPS